MNDHNIIELFFARDEAAIQHTEEAYGHRLFATANHILENHQDAEESVSDTYLRAWETIPPQRPRYFFAYLAKICRNFALKRLEWNNAAKRKAQVVSITQELELCIPDGTRDMDSLELGQILDAFLRTLSPDNRIVFLRRYWFGDSIGEIASRYQLSESAVLMRLNRTRTKLRTHLEQEGIIV
ncbi:MAG: sigma-70 family RNA polymerase sigma factor [Ruminiclostridium sp.]|nr:sigma-70 family RNA polymerase sigma factor [Ruminiclostridium sp.]